LGDDRDNGFYVQPTIYTGLPESARCVKEEILGRCATLRLFDSEEEAVALANDTKYGLAAFDMDRQSEAWPSRSAANECGHHMGELLVLARSANAIRRSGDFLGLAAKGGMHSLNFYSS